MARFEATIDSILTDLSSVMGKMHGQADRWCLRFGGRVSKTLEQDLTRIGLTIAQGALDLYPSGVAIGFKHNDVGYELSCTQHEATMDNLRAAQQGVTWSWRIYREYGVRNTHARPGDDPFDDVFAGHRVERLALGPGGDAPWWQVLGISRETPLAAIEQEYRRLMRHYHPDNKETGLSYMATVLNKAIAAAREEKGA